MIYGKRKESMLALKRSSWYNVKTSMNNNKKQFIQHLNMNILACIGEIF